MTLLKNVRDRGHPLLIRNVVTAYLCWPGPSVASLLRAARTPRCPEWAAASSSSTDTLHEPAGETHPDRDSGASDLSFLGIAPARWNRSKPLSRPLLRRSPG